YRRSADGRLFPRSRFQWGLFVGTKGDDAWEQLSPGRAKDPPEVRPINLQMNLHGGFNLNKIHRLSLDFPDPPGGYGGLYMDQKVVEALKERVRTDKSYYRYLYNAEPTGRPLLDVWVDAKGDKLRDAIREVRKTATDILTAFVNGDGTYNFQFINWHGGL